MKDLLQDRVTLSLLELLVQGRGVDVNVSQLAKRFNHHRQTVKERLNYLYSNNIVTKPFYPFNGLLDVMNILVVSKDEFCRDQKTNSFIESDSQIYTAFVCKEEVYNTITIQLHRDLYTYHKWCENLYQGDLITRCDNQHFSEAILFSSQRILKFNPSSPIPVLTNEIKKSSLQCINGHKIDDLTLDILTSILKGECIRTNENLIAKELGIQRKTVIRKIGSLLETNTIFHPKVFFPKIFGPSDFIIILSLIEIKKDKDLIIKKLVTDPHITVLIHANEGKYNLFMTTTFPAIENYLEWQEEMNILFPGCIGAMRNTFLSPHKSFLIDHNNVALAFIRNQINSI